MIGPVFEKSVIARELIGWAGDVTGLRWHWADQHAPRPAYPYGTIKLVSGPNKIGTVEKRQEADGKISHHAIGTLSFSFQVFVSKNDGGKMTDDFDAFGLLSGLIMSKGLQSSETRFKTANIGPVDSGDNVRSLDEVIQDEYISRAQTDLIFTASLAMIEDVGWFEQAVIETTVTAPDGSILDTQTITVPAS